MWLLYVIPRCMVSLIFSFSEEACTTLYTPCFMLQVSSHLWAFPKDLTEKIEFVLCKFIFSNTYKVFHSNCLACAPERERFN